MCEDERIPNSARGEGASAVEMVANKSVYDDARACEWAKQHGLRISYVGRGAESIKNLRVDGGEIAITGCNEYATKVAHITVNRAKMLYRLREANIILEFVARHDFNQSIRLLAATMLGDDDLTKQIYNELSIENRSYCLQGNLFLCNAVIQCKIGFFKDEFLKEIVMNKDEASSIRAQAFKLLKSGMEETVGWAEAKGIEKDDRGFALIAMYGDGDIQTATMAYFNDTPSEN